MPVTACTEERTRREPQSVVLSLARDKSTSGNLDVSSVLARSQSQHARRQCAGVQWPGTTTVIAAVLCILCLVVAAKAWDHSYLIIWMKWLQEHEEEGRVLFVLGYAACLLLLLPASLLAVLAGVCFGLYWGIMLVYAANLLGQTLAFLLARTLMQQPLRTLITRRWPQFPAIDAAVRREGWRLVFVLRLSPCIPFSLLNYALGLTGVSFLEYSAASAVAVIPFVVIAVYLGLASGNAVQMLQEHAWAGRGRGAAPYAGGGVDASALFRVDALAANVSHAVARNMTRGGSIATDSAVTAALGARTDGFGDGGASAHSTAVTVTACLLAVATGAYSIWFIRKVTSEALAEVLDTHQGDACGAGGAAGAAERGPFELEDVAEVTSPLADAGHSVKRSARHAEAWVGVDVASPR